MNEFHQTIIQINHTTNIVTYIYTTTSNLCTTLTHKRTEVSLFFTLRGNSLWNC